jgi:hypothetical protein
MVVRLNKVVSILLLLLSGLIIINGLAQATDNATIYANTITGGSANSSYQITGYNDSIIQNIEMYLFPNNTSAVQPEKAIYEVTKPFYFNGVGSWWIVIVILTMGAIFWFDHNGSPFLIILLLMIGNSVLWVFIPYDWMGTIVVCAIFSLALIVVTALRGRG